MSLKPTCLILPTLGRPNVFFKRTDHLPILQQHIVLHPRKLRNPVQRPTARVFASKSKKHKEEMAPNIGVILGTMTFGWSSSSSSIDNNLAGQMLDVYFNAGFSDVDTALTYAGGKTEKMIGEIMGAGSLRASKCGVLATKAGPWEGTATMSGNGGLAPAQLRRKVEASLSSLCRDKIDLLYLHAPDSGTVIEQTLVQILTQKALLEEVHRLHTEGKIGALGLSNFQAWEVCHIYHTCKANGYLLPTVYQGMYNAVTREVERELLPCLRKLNIAFYAYNPLAGGILTGKHRKDGGAASAGRFKGNKLYTDRFWKESYLDAAETLIKACEAQKDPGTTPVDAAMRWLKYHSQLKDGDAIIIGASSLSQLESNIKALKASDPLPDDTVTALDSAWAKCAPACPAYERGHSAI